MIKAVTKRAVKTSIKGVSVAICLSIVGCGAAQTKSKSSSAAAAGTAAGGPQGSTATGDAAAQAASAGDAPATAARNGAKPAAPAAAAGVADDALTDLIVLGPADLGLKIFAAFGRNMTLYSSGSGNNSTQMDYLTTNADLFTGAVSDMPYSTIPSTLGVPYYMAVSALARIVGTNYATALVTDMGGIVANDCRQMDGATAIMRITYPAISDPDLATLAKQTVDACNTDGPAVAAQAIIQSYAFLDKEAI